MVAARTFCRLTVLTPRSRVDVALPVDVPVAELVPMLLELVGEPSGSGLRPVPWRLAGTVGGPLPAAATLAELGMPDGETLRLAPAIVPPPAPVFDDPIDALAASAGGSADRGATEGDRRFGAGALLVVAAAAGGLLASGGPGATAAAVVAGTAAVAAVWAAAWLARQDRGGGPFDAVTAALIGVPPAAAAGWTAVPAAGTPTALLLAVGVAGVVAALAQIAVRVVAPALVGIVVAAALTGAALVGVRFGAAPQVAAAAAGGLALVLGPLLPRAAIRLAGLPRPTVPSGPDLRADGGRPGSGLPPHELAERADLARGYLAGLVGGCATVAAGGAVLAAVFDRAGGGWFGVAFAGVTVVALGLRARGYADPGPVRTSVVAAVGGGVALATLAGAGGSLSVLVATGLLAVSAIGLLVLGRATGPMSPVARRGVDLVEGLFVVAAVPLALGAMGLYRLARGL